MSAIKQQDNETARKVLASATELFARSGFDGVSVRDICRAADVSDNAVHYHFKSKLQLFQTIVHSFGLGLLESAQRVLKASPDSIAALRTRLEVFLEETTLIFLENRDLLQIAFTEFMQMMPHCEDEVAQTFLSHHHLVNDYIKNAQAQGLLRKQLDPEIFSDILFESLAMRVLTCNVANLFDQANIADPEYRKHWIAQHVSIVLEGSIAH